MLHRSTYPDRQVMVGGTALGGRVRLAAMVIAVVSLLTAAGSDRTVAGAAGERDAASL